MDPFGWKLSPFPLNVPYPSSWTRVTLQRSFLERVESQLENKKKKQAQNGLDLVSGNETLSKEYTFKPKVTLRAQNHRSRTGTEMSRDHQWFETKRVGA